MQRYCSWLWHDAAASTGGHAQNSQGTRFDDNSCQAWQGSSGDPDLRAAQVAWARGFLSGHNYADQRQQVTDVSAGTIERNMNGLAGRSAGLFIDAAYRMSDSMSGRDGPIRKWHDQLQRLPFIRVKPARRHAAGRCGGFQ